MFTVNIYSDVSHSITTYDNENEAREAMQSVVWTLSVAGREGSYATIGDDHGRRILDSRDLTGGTNQKVEDTYEEYVDNYDVEAAERRIGA